MLRGHNVTGTYSYGDTMLRGGDTTLRGQCNEEGTQRYGDIMLQGRICTVWG